jgi:hypothetical protein
MRRFFSGFPQSVSIPGSRSNQHPERLDPSWFMTNAEDVNLTIVTTNKIDAIDKIGTYGYFR